MILYNKLNSVFYTKCKLCGGEVDAFLAQFELVKCKTCELVFYNQQLNGEHVKEIYAKLYNQQDAYFMYKAQAENLKKGIKPHIGYNKHKVLNKILKQRTSSFVEIGAGIGLVGKYLQNKGKQYQGIELDSEAARLANEAGANVATASFHALADYNNNIDTILAFEVIEHLDDLKLCFKLMQNALILQGYIGFSVPNFKRYYNASKEVQVKKLGQPGPPVHINFFTKESITKILKHFGFIPIYIRVRPFPDLKWGKISTYQKLWKTVKGQYNGPTILCVAQKIS